MANHTMQSALECGSFEYATKVVPVLYLVMFFVALPLNCVAAWVSVHLRSTSNFIVYLKNLVAADLIMTLTIPIKAASSLLGKSNMLFVLNCRYFSVIFYSTQYTCITLLGLIGLDRFFKILRPRSQFSQKLIFSQLISASVWLLVFGCTALPTIILSNKPISNLTEITNCMMLKEPVGRELHKNIVIFLNVFFWLISVVIVVCYICIANKVIQSFRKSGSSNNQGKQKIKLRVFMVLIVFIVSFGPYHMFRIPYTFKQVSSFDTCLYSEDKLAKDLTLWLATTNICMDPLLYVFLCREFKEKLMSFVQHVSVSSPEAKT